VISVVETKHIRHVVKKRFESENGNIYEQVDVDTFNKHKYHADSKN